MASLRPLVFLAKKEVADWPVLGWLARLQGAVFIDRSDRRAIPQINAALEQVLRAGRDLVVFAEGTSSDGASVLKFNAAHFAVLTNLVSSEPAHAVTLAPIALAYAQRDRAGGVDGPVDVGWYGDMTFLPHLWGLMKSGVVVCHVVFAEAVEIAGCDRKALAGASEARVRALLQATR